MSEKQLVICKACKYVMDADQVKDICPACGVSAKAFEPYTPRMSEKREAILEMHLHPIAVHFPQAFVALAIFFDVLHLFVKGSLSEIVVAGILINTVLLPPSVIAATFAGAFDGKVRFKKLSPPILQRKIRIAIAYFLVSLVAAVLVLVGPLTTTVILIEIALMVICFGLAFLLGKTGAKLMGIGLPN